MSLNSKAIPMKTYSRKSISRSSSQFDALISCSTSSTKTSAAAVTVSRWGQTSFTSVRRQKELENNSNNSNSNSDQQFQEIKKQKLEKSIETKPLLKPKVNKFFKSRTNTALLDDIVNDKTIRDNAEKQIIKSNDNNDKQEIEVKPKSYNNFKEIKSKTVEIKKKEIKSYKTNDKSMTEQKVRNQNMRNDKKGNYKTNNSKKESTSPVVSVKGIRSSRRLQGVEPEVVKKEVKQKLNDKSVDSPKIETKIDEIKDEQSQPIVDTFVESDIMTDNEIEDQNDTIDSDSNHYSKDEPISLPQQLLDECIDNSSGDNPSDNIPESKCSSPHSSDEFIEPKSLSQPIINQTSLQTDELYIEKSESQLTQSQPEISSSSASSSSTSSLTVINKPKKKIFSSSKKNRAVFNTKNFWTTDSKEFRDEFDSQLNNQSVASSSAVADPKNDFDFNDDSNYVKLHRVKKAHQCHDLGETEQFDDDIKYHLSGIESSNTISMRCLSILGLSQQAMRPEFRMHLRAHDDMPRIISALMDAPIDPNLALCTATLMFVYSQDRLTMDIDPNALSLMLQLLETRSDECTQVELKHMNKIMNLCEEMKNKGHAKYLKLNQITAGKLAMETLLGLTSKRAGDWFKEELRKIKGIDFILDTVIRCAEFDKDQGFMVKIDRCMHVLENVTFNNIENQSYLLKYKDGLLASTCIQLLHSCKYQIILSNDSKVFLSAFFSILRVLTHLTSESADGCLSIGTYDGILDLLLESLFELPTFILSDQRFDLMVILLCLCINLVEFCPQIRQLVVNNNSKINRLIELLFKRIEEAQKTEQQADELLESHQSVQLTEQMQDNLLKQIISQSGNHMEHSIIAACISLLLGCCIQDNYDYTNILRENLPNLSFDPMVEVLQKLRDFAYLTDIMTKKGKERVDRIIQVFKSS